MVNSKSESQPIDSFFIKCTYKLTYLPDSNNLTKKFTDVLNLYVGKKTFMFFSQTKFLKDSSFEAAVKNGSIQDYLKDPSLRNQHGSSWLYSNCHLYFNYPEGKITITDKIGDKQYYYEENIENINWDIVTDTISILNYKCQKAITFFRGRKYEAWFTNEIPISYGPYKFRGLPGLIIKIRDIKNNYIYECTAIQKRASAIPLNFNNRNYSKTTRSNFRQAFKASFENPWQTFFLNNNVSISGPDADKVKAIVQRSIPYNPIELE